MEIREPKPELKEIKPINFLFHRAEVKLADSANQIPIAKKIFAEASRLDLHPTAPHPLALLWFYGR